MRLKPPNPVLSLLLFLASAAAWAAWLGWDHHYDIHPDGSETGPYEPWQVIGLVLTLLASVSWAAFRCHGTDAVLGTTAGLTAAAYYDWSDDSSGLFLVGVGMVAVASLVVTLALSALIGAVARGQERHSAAGLLDGRPR
ncbi:hypothetical protein [Kitasatospora sp. MBT63]|uniref:hypothetical protein n=1 Tax=Kitasatospora sp. MBT63 TaxID=1444768 RepID=UPI00068E8653|nr:hypothetical protein [Kitasatospora sp. MBT63]